MTAPLLWTPKHAHTHARGREAGMEADRWKAGRQADRQEQCFRGIQSLGLFKVFYSSTHGRNVRSKSTSTSLGSNYSDIPIVSTHVYLYVENT